MIFTLTLNPALDLEYRVDRIRMGEIHRAAPARADWGGKGFNVSRVLQILGIENIAVGFAGGYTGKRLEEGLCAAGVKTELVWLAEETRTNISVVGAWPGDYLKVNEPGPAVGANDIQRLLDRIQALTRPGDDWILSGSLTTGTPVDFYASAIRMVKDKGGRALLDTSGLALWAGCEAGPALVKPNAEEATEMTGMSMATPLEAAAAAQRIAASGPEKVVVSLGSKGAVGVDGVERWFAHPLPVRTGNPVGAGDALVAGLAAGWTRGWSMPEMLRLGSACGASAASQPGTGIGSRDEIEAYQRAVVVEAI